MTLTSLSCARAWRDSLRSCIALNEYCLERFGQEPRLYLGVDFRDLPGSKQAPYIALVPFGTRGGPTALQTEASVRVAVGANYSSDPERPSEREFEFTAYHEMEEDLWPIVLQALIDAGGDLAPDEVDLEMDPQGVLGKDYLELRAEVRVTRDNTID